MPGLETAYHVRLLQRVQVGAHGIGGNAERGGQFAAVPYLAVIVRDHRPQPPHQRRGKSESQQSQIALEKSPRKIFAPSHAVLVVFRQK